MSRTKPTTKGAEAEVDHTKVPEQSPAETLSAKNQPQPSTVEDTTAPGTPLAEEQKDQQIQPLKTEEPKTITVYVLCAGSVGGQRYSAGVVLEGVPEEVAQAHAPMLDLHPAAVNHAMATGATVVAYGEA